MTPVYSSTIDIHIIYLFHLYIYRRRGNGQRKRVRHANKPSVICTRRNG